MALKEIEAGQQGALNDDDPRGGLTPDTDTLQAWLDADGTLEIFVELQKGKSGIVVLEEGVVEEVLSLSIGVSNITVTWDAVNDRLSLQGSASATVGHFEAALAALQLQTVRFKDDSTRTISVSPNVAGDVPKKDFYVREVKVGASPIEPLLSVRGFTKILATAERYLVLSESHILVDDVDTRDVNGNVDASKITLRITELLGGTLEKRISASADWAPMREVSIGGISQGYYAFTLADLQVGLVSVKASAGVSSLTFKVQAADDENNFSDSDPNDDDADPASVSIPVVALKEVEAGQKGALNDDRPRGGLTPDANTLQAWLAADGTLEIFVELQGGRSGIVVLGEGAVEESLSLSAGVSNITAIWDAGNDRLSLRGDASAMVVISRRLWLHYSCRRFVSGRTAIARYRSRPNLSGDVPKKDFYVREVKVGASPEDPLLSVRGFAKILATAERPVVLGESHILVDDMDTRDSVDPTKVDASRIKFRITNIRNGKLMRRPDTSSPWVDVDPASGTQYPGVQPCGLARWFGFPGGVGLLHPRSPSISRLWTMRTTSATPTATTIKMTQTRPASRYRWLHSRRSRLGRKSRSTMTARVEGSRRTQIRCRRGSPQTARWRYSWSCREAGAESSCSEKVQWKRVSLCPAVFPTSR